ncbi:hypothetical protein FM112_10345 [Gulosibacter sp. 10]|nr:hypothetical protein FM112_10345 [Gulosibacter sp. 10]
MRRSPRLRGPRNRGLRRICARSRLRPPPPPGFGNWPRTVVIAGA